MAGTVLASPSDLCTRLGIEEPDSGSQELKQLEAVLEDASGELESIIGQPLAKMTSTITLFIDGKSERHTYIDLPARPVHSVESVIVRGVQLPAHRYRVKNLTIVLPLIDEYEPVEVTFTHGYDPIPEEMTKWVCVLAASSYASTQATASLGMVAGISQHTRTVDGYTEGWANYTGNRIPGLTLPSEVAARLRAQYGTGGIETLRFR